MTIEEFLSLQIGTYVTENHEFMQDLWMRTDFCRIMQFDRYGRILLRPLNTEGNPSEDGESFWVHFKDYNLKQKFTRSEYLENTL